MLSWKKFKLSDCLTKVERPVEVVLDKHYAQIGIRSHGKGLFHKESVTGEELGNKVVYWVEPDCFVLNIVFAWEQAIGKTTSSEAGMIASHRFPMYRPKDNLVDIDYLISFFMTKKGKDILEAASPGGAGRNRTLGQVSFLNSVITLPSIAEQRKIAEILSAQDRVIELKTKLLEEKKCLKKYLCQSLLRGKTRISGYTGVWKRKRLCDIAHRVTARNTKNCNNVLTISACDGLVEQEAYFKKEVAGKDKSNYFFLSQDDYAYNRSSSRGNPYGAIKRLRKHSSGIVSPLYVCFRMNKELVDYNYAEYAFDSGVLNKELGMVVQEGARNHGLLNIAIEDFFNCRIELPAYDEQVKIAEILRVVFCSVELQEKELEQEKLKKKAMMQQLLTGKVRVSV